MIESQMTLTTRISDLDTQRHVTSRAYESLCYDGRFHLLEEQGHTIEKLLTENFRLVTLRSEVRFFQQQKSGAELTVRTRVHSRKSGELLWDQEVLQSDGKAAARIRTLTRPENASGGIKLLKASKKTEEPGLFPDARPFSGGCRRTSSSWTMGFSDRDIFGQPYVSALWKVFEEGRWMFSTQNNLTLEKFIEIDTTTFFMGGRIDVFAPVPPSRPLTVLTWIRNLGGIRFNFCQDVLDADGSVLMRMEDEQLVVSVSKARPKRPPQELIQIMHEFIEPDAPAT